MKVTVVMALPGTQWVEDVELPEGATVADAIEAAGLAGRVPAGSLETARVGIWNKEATRAALLREGDRVEIYREISADARAMRRARAAASPSKRARSGR